MLISAVTRVGILTSCYCQTQDYSGTTLCVCVFPLMTETEFFSLQCHFGYRLMFRVVNLFVFINSLSDQHFCFCQKNKNPSVITLVFMIENLKIIKIKEQNTKQLLIHQWEIFALYIDIFSLTSSSLSLFFLFSVPHFQEQDDTDIHLDIQMSFNLAFKHRHTLACTHIVFWENVFKSLNIFP